MGCKRGLLSPMETTVLVLLSQGYTRKEMARNTGRSISTISTHVESIALKLDARNAAEMVTRGFVNGILVAPIDARRLNDLESEAA